MENARKIIKDNEFESLENLIETLNELNGDIVIRIKDTLECFSNFSCDSRTTKTKNSSLLANVNQMERMLKTSSGVDKIKACFCYINDDKSDNLNVLFLIHSELKKETNIQDIKTTNDLVEVLNRCYSIKNSHLESVQAKSLANSFIMNVSELIFKRKQGLLQKSDNANFMSKNFKKILKSISKNVKIVISDEKKFYELLSKHFSAMGVDEQRDNENSKKYDILKSVKENILDYNNKIFELNDPINLEAKTFLEYLLNTSVENLEYGKFPSYENVNFLKIISKTRQKLVEEKYVEEFPEKLAILDIYHATYYRSIAEDKVKYTDDSIAEKANKKSA